MKPTVLNYIELPIIDMAESKAFYAKAFGWEFQDYGPTYAAITNAGIDGGLDAASDRKPSVQGTLAVLLSNDLDASLNAVKDAGANISKEIFDFPGGRRFHFVDPSGNDLSVWTLVSA